MAQIPVGEFDAGRIATELYDDEAVRSPLFAEVYKIWPDGEYNVAGSDEWERAVDMILDGFETAVEGRFSEEEWDSVRDELFEMVDAGLT